MKDDPCKKLKEKEKIAKEGYLRSIEGPVETPAENTPDGQEAPIIYSKGLTPKIEETTEKFKSWEKAKRDLSDCRKKHPKT